MIPFFRLSSRIASFLACEIIRGKSPAKIFSESGIGRVVTDTDSETTSLSDLSAVELESLSLHYEYN